MNNDKDPKWSGKNQPHGRQPDHQNQSGPPEDSARFPDEERLPTEVVGALEKLDQHDHRVPDSVRTAILKDAADVLKRQKNRPVKKAPFWTRRSWMGISAGVLASAVLVAVMLPTQPDALNSPTATSGPLADSANGASAESVGFRAMGVPSGKDVDGNGRVNILDAFALARTVEGNQSTGRFETAELDQNGDGVVNLDDVNSIAMSVVML